MQSMWKTNYNKLRKKNNKGENRYFVGIFSKIVKNLLERNMLWKQIK